MERSDYYKSLSEDVKCRYEDKLKVVDGIDPYLLEVADFGDGNLLQSLPEVTMMDLVNYLILTHSFYTGQQLKAFKSLQAFKFYESGLVQNVRVKQVNPNAYLVVGKVKHSQRFREKPLEVWVIVLNDGSISSGHCTCMAGLGEVCSHIAAILFYLNARPTTEDEACTSKLSLWPVPPLKNVEMCRIKNIDWARNMKVTAPTGIPKMSEEEMGIFVQKLHDDVGVTCAAARLLEPVASKLYDNISPKLPLCLASIFNNDYVGKQYEEILQAANEIEVAISQEEIVQVEEATRGQSLSMVWLNQRTGRITASIFKAVCRTSLEKPSISVIKGICYPQKMLFSSKQTKYGIKHEDDALNAYAEAEKGNHLDFIVQKSGFFISDRFPALGASRDGIFYCNRCVRGCIEVKCPYLLKDMTLVEYAQKKTTCLKISADKICLDRNHSYYYQVQLQMFVTKTAICHFVIWSRNILFVEKIKLDDNFLMENVVKGVTFFKNVVKPELLGKYFTERAGSSNISIWCICKKVEDGRKMIRCDNDDCNIGWFHFDCVGLEEVPDTYWFCNNCSL